MVARMWPRRMPFDCLPAHTTARLPFKKKIQRRRTEPLPSACHNRRFASAPNRRHTRRALGVSPLHSHGTSLITRATIDAATRVTEYAACRPVALNLSVMPTPWVADAGPQLDD